MSAGTGPRKTNTLWSGVQSYRQTWRRVSKLTAAQGGMNETAKVSAEEKRSWSRADTESKLDTCAPATNPWSCPMSTGDLTAATAS